MVEYSEDYHAHAVAGNEADRWPTDSRGRFEVGIPPEFGGGFDGPAPENYYAVALTNCFVATFKTMAANSGLDFEEITADGTLQLRPDDGSTAVDAFELDVDLYVESPGGRAERVLERTRDYCFILDSVAFPVTVDHAVVSV